MATRVNILDSDERNFKNEKTRVCSLFRSRSAVPTVEITILLLAVLTLLGFLLYRNSAKENVSSMNDNPTRILNIFHPVLNNTNDTTTRSSDGLSSVSKQFRNKFRKIRAGAISTDATIAGATTTPDTKLSDASVDKGTQSIGVTVSQNTESSNMPTIEGAESTSETNTQGISGTDTTTLELTTIAMSTGVAITSETSSTTIQETGMPTTEQITTDVEGTTANEIISSQTVTATITTSLETAAETVTASPETITEGITTEPEVSGKATVSTTLEKTTHTNLFGMSTTTTITPTSTTTIITTRTTKDNVTQLVNSSCLVNAWIFLNEDEAPNTTYNSSNSSFQRLIRHNVYQSVDILFISFVNIIITSSDTTPAGNGYSYTIRMDPVPHLSGLTNQDYMNYMIFDAQRNNPNIKIVVTLNWGDGSLISNIFSTSKYSPREAAKHFATNLMVYLKKHDLDGFDIDWEYPISYGTSKKQFTLLINAIGAAFERQTDKHYYLTLSPDEVANLDAEAVNNYIDFINLQLYSGFTDPDDFKNAGVNPNLFAYGAKFESNYQTARQAYRDNKENYHYNIFTSWRLNSDDYIFEQTQQQRLHNLCSGFHL